MAAGAVLEQHKENIEARPEGRAGAQLSNHLAHFNPASAPALRADLDSMHADFLARADRPADDPLQLAVDHLARLRTQVPSGDSRAIRETLNFCVTKYSTDPRYTNDKRFLRIWLDFVKLARNPIEAFKYMAQTGVGQKRALFYEEYAAALEARGWLRHARDVYLFGLFERADPRADLKRAYQSFKARHPNPQGIDEPEDAALPRPDRVLAARPTSRAPAPGAQQAAGAPAQPPVPGANGLKRIAVFQDTEAAEPSAGPIPDFSEKENQQAPQPWAGQRLLQAQEPPKKVLRVFRDPLEATAPTPEGAAGANAGANAGGASAPTCPPSRNERHAVDLALLLFDEHRSPAEIMLAQRGLGMVAGHATRREVERARQPKPSAQFSANTLSGKQTEYNIVNGVLRDEDTWTRDGTMLGRTFEQTTFQDPLLQTKRDFDLEMFLDQDSARATGPAPPPAPAPVPAGPSGPIPGAGPSGAMHAQRPGQFAQLTPQQLQYQRQQQMRLQQMRFRQQQLQAGLQAQQGQPGQPQHGHHVPAQPGQAHGGQGPRPGMQVGQQVGGPGGPGLSGPGSSGLSGPGSRQDGGQSNGQGFVRGPIEPQRPQVRAPVPPRSLKALAPAPIALQPLRAPMEPVVDAATTEIRRRVYPRFRDALSALPIYRFDSTAKGAFQSYKTPPVSGRAVALPGFSFVISKTLGEGGFGIVLRTKVIDGVSYAVKVEKSPIPWELYTVLQLRARIDNERARLSIVEFRLYQGFADEQYTVMPVYNKGTLLKLTNTIYNSPSAAPRDIETVAVYFAIELLRTMAHVHRAGIIHGDLKPENVMLRVMASGAYKWPSSHFHRSDPAWAKVGIVLLDFGRSIDTHLFPPGQRFRTGWQIDREQDCYEACEGLPWTYEIDYHGVANIIYHMLQGQAMKVVRQNGTGPKVPSTPLGPRASLPFWHKFFRTLLNPPELPIADLAALQSELETWLEKRSEPALNTLLSRYT